MVTGAARAEAAVLVIDAKEGIRENSKRHGYLLAMLGIKQIAVVVNKMDLVGYSREVFEDIRDEYISFLARIGAAPKFFLPVAAFHGENLVQPSDKMPWYTGHNLLSAVDAFKKEPPKPNQPFRMPVQDVYKFTALGDDRRIVAGRVESGSVRAGDEVVFLPSGKKSRVKSIEAFHAAPREEMAAGVLHRVHPGGADLRGPRRIDGQDLRNRPRSRRPPAGQPVLDGQEALRTRAHLLSQAGHGQGARPPQQDQRPHRRLRDRRRGRPGPDRIGRPSPPWAATTWPIASSSWASPWPSIPFPAWNPPAAS